jgi:hypothetical protein
VTPSSTTDCCPPIASPQQPGCPGCQPKDIRDLILDSQTIAAKWTMERPVDDVYTFTERNTSAPRPTTVQIAELQAQLEALTA